ncbi:hypothetical protein [Thomasclavelia sp.]|uniref:hypothetical protein n=1 Tax=Thomasclavelia sp. TaxID=3025757 RepID=UPI0025F05374|nr:hypothetical protein [Thomasclavelia sp.]
MLYSLLIAGAIITSNLIWKLGWWPYVYNQCHLDWISTGKYKDRIKYYYDSMKT